MQRLPLNLIVFATTMGHGGRHTYKETIEGLFSKIDPAIFTNLLLHLKTREGEEKIADKIKDFCLSFHIRVLETKENIVHHSENHLTHSAAYFKDIFKAYSDLEIRKTKYSLWLEDDAPIMNQNIDLFKAFQESIFFLDENPDQLCVRFNRSEGFNDAQEGSIKENNNFFTQDSNYTKYGPTFTFQPNISRTNEIFIAWKMAQAHLDKLGSYHCELMSGDLLKNMTNSKTPFSFFNPLKVYSKDTG